MWSQQLVIIGGKRGSDGIVSLCEGNNVAIITSSALLMPVLKLYLKLLHRPRHAKSLLFK